MDRARILVAAHRQLLESFSQRTTRSLRGALPIPMALPWLDRLLAENVAKEVRKDALVIEYAAAAVASGDTSTDAALTTLLAATKAIDRDFLSGLGGVPLVILIRYDQIEPIRRQRIERLLTAATTILGGWRGGRGLRHALRQHFPGADLEHLVFDLLSLYAMETKLLGEAVRLPFPLAPLRQRIVGRLHLVMRSIAGELAKELSSQIGGGRNRR